MGGDEELPGADLSFQERIEIDLDDGVKVNYLKFPNFLAKIPGMEKKEEE